MNTKQWIMLCTLALLWAGPGFGEERVPVTVAFRLEQPQYRAIYGPDLSKLEAEVAKLLVRNLEARIKLVRFTVEPSDAYTLTFRLNDLADKGQKGETVLHIQLNGTGVRPHASSFWRFRESSGFAAPIRPADAFLLEIDKRVKTILADGSYQNLVSDWLVQVPVARNSTPHKSPPGWVLPFRRDDLCLDFDSNLRIDSMLPVGGMQLNRSLFGRVAGDFPTQTPDVRGLIFVELNEDRQPDRQWLREFMDANPAQITVLGVYVIRFVSLEPCAAPVPPRSNRF